MDLEVTGCVDNYVVISAYSTYYYFVYRLTFKVRSSLIKSNLPTHLDQHHLFSIIFDWLSSLVSETCISQFHLFLISWFSRQVNVWLLLVSAIYCFYGMTIRGNLCRCIRLWQINGHTTLRTILWCYVWSTSKQLGFLGIFIYLYELCHRNLASRRCWYSTTEHTLGSFSSRSRQSRTDLIWLDDCWEYSLWERKRFTRRYYRRSNQSKYSSIYSTTATG